MLNNALNRPIYGRYALVIGSFLLLSFLSYLLFSSQLFNAQPFNTEGLIAIEQAKVEESGKWFQVTLPHQANNSYSDDQNKTHFRFELPPNTPTTGYALLVPSYRYQLAFQLNGKTLLTTGNKDTLWLYPTLPRVVIPLDLRERGISNSILQLDISGASIRRGLDKIWIGPIDKINKARNPLTELRPEMFFATLMTLTLLMVFLAIEGNYLRASRPHLMVLIPQFVLTFLFIPPESLSTSVLAFKIYQSSFLLTVLAWGAFLCNYAGIKLRTLKWPMLISIIALIPTWLSSNAEETQAWAIQSVATTAGTFALLVTLWSLTSLYRSRTSISNHIALLLTSMLFGAGLCDIALLKQQHAFGQALAYPYFAEFVAFILIAHLAVKTSERQRELQLHQKNMSTLVQARTEELELAQSKLIRHERLQTLNAMGAAVSHEIKSPLATLANDLHTLDKITDSRSAQEQKLLQRMNRSVSRIDRTLSDLSSYAQLSQISDAPIDFSHWLHQLLNGEEIKSLTEGAIVQSEIQAHLSLRFDADMMRRAMINVIKNAVNASAERYSPQLFVAAIQQGDTIVVRIEDNGTGLPEKLAESIFEPLVSGSRSGLGLGLSVVTHIMRLHGGSLEISNRIDTSGAVVSLHLPIDKELQQQDNSLQQ